MKICLFIALIATNIAFGSEGNRVMANRDEVFLLGKELLIAKGDWKAIFCDANNLDKCDLVKPLVIQDKCCRETLTDGKKVNTFSYESQSGKRLMFFIKGLDSKHGSITAKSFASDTDQPSSFEWNNHQYMIEPDWPNLIIKSSGQNKLKQSINIFKDLNHTCDPSKCGTSGLFYRFWIADLDRDNKPDFYIRASGIHASCWPNGSQNILILSKGAVATQIGKEIKAKGHRMR